MRYRMYFHETTSVTQECYDRTTFRFPKASPSLTIQHHDSTCPNTMPCENESSREINVKANPPVATLKRVMSRRHRVIEFSPQPSLHLSFLFFLCFCLSHLSCSSSRRLRRHACQRPRWAGLACQNLPDATVLPAWRCKSRRTVERWEENHEEEERRAMELDGKVKTDRGWTVFGCL